MLAVVFLTFMAFHNVLFLGWVDWDDKVHIIDNPLVKNLSWNNIRQMFLTPELNGSYIPLTELSWALNYRMAGLDPFGYHLANLMLHLGSTGLVFLFIKKLTGHEPVAFLTAVLFGIHPMHVEPVAWITGRKDVLYGFLFLSSLTCYTNYAMQTKKKSGLLIFSLLLFALSLFSKGVAVVLPLLMLLIDRYVGRKATLRLIVEKLPFFMLSLAFGLVAIIAQEQTVALKNIADVPYHISAVTSSYSLTLYLIQVLAPFQVGAFHPYPPKEMTLPMYMVLSVVVPFLLISLLFLFRNKKNIVFGLAFFLISFLPVIQFIPVGGAIVADRYTYIPYIGMFLVFSWLIVRLCRQSRGAFRSAFLVSVVGYILVLCGMAHSSTKIWSNSLNLWTNVIEQHPHDSKGYINRGRYFYDKGDMDLAKQDFEAALEISPQLPVVYQHFGLFYQKKRMFDEALFSFGKAIDLDSVYTAGWLNMAVTHMHMDQLDTALYFLARLESLDTGNILVHINRGVIYEQRSEFDRAVREYDLAVSKKPYDYKGFQYRAVVNYRLGRYVDALNDVEEWMNRAPRNAKAYVWRSRIRFVKREFVQAKLDIDKAINFGASVNEEYLRILTDSLHTLDSSFN